MFRHCGGGFPKRRTSFTKFINVHLKLESKLELTKKVNELLHSTNKPKTNPLTLSLFSCVHGTGARTLVLLSRTDLIYFIVSKSFVLGKTNSSELQYNSLAWNTQYSPPKIKSTHDLSIFKLPLTFLLIKPDYILTQQNISLIYNLKIK